MKLVIANKAYSSWSFRPWILMREMGIAFDEEMIPLYHPDTQARIRAYGGGRTVPLVVDGAIVVWESLAIVDYLAEMFPNKAIWPVDPASRAHARSSAAEMHGGFQALRSRCPMNFRRAPKAVALSDDVKANVARIEQLWADARQRFGAGGPFLYGKFSAADAMYAPVVHRFQAYAVPVSASTRAYMDTIMGLPSWGEWASAAAAEPWHHAPYDEVS